MSALKAVDTLLRLKRRRVEQHRDAMQARTQVLRAKEAERDEVRGREDAARQEKRRCTRTIDKMLSDPFRGSDLLAMRFVLSGLVDALKAASQATAAAEAQVQAAADELRASQRALQQAEAVVEFLQERRAKLVKEIEDAVEEMQDEESEEAAVARLIARMREVALEEAAA
jgi:hypothetical protein